MHDFLLHREMQRVSAQVASALTRIATARKIPDVVQAAGQVQVGAMFRSIRHLFPELKRLDQAANRRLDELLQAQLAAIAAATTAEEARAMRGRYLATDWQALRGRFSRQFVHADRESQRLIHRKKSAEPGPS